MTEIEARELYLRAASPLSERPRPFLRWAGSKRGLLGQLVPHLPSEYGAYFEPFLGAGSMFFLLRPPVAYLNDSCTELIETYRAVRQDTNAVIAAARAIPMTKEAFYQTRGARSADPATRAGELLYLNRACFNGLYRVNSSGQFNVPWGAPKTDFVVDAENLRACQEVLLSGSVTLDNADFESVLEPCVAGDLVFLDPPYVTRHNNNGFIDYNERLFSWDDQRRLASRAEELRAGGCHVVVTNAFHAEVLALYPQFSVYELSRSSTLASSASRRGRVSEAILVGRPK